jgi:hypothetical protein
MDQVHDVDTLKKAFVESPFSPGVRIPPMKEVF